MEKGNAKLTRIGVFYDGNYFLHVSNFYNYSHPIRSRIDITGISELIRKKVAEYEHTTPNLCQIVDSHYFRGRLSAYEANQKGNQLFYDRLFDDILMAEGVVTHYLPIRNRWGRREEKGIDVWLALEAFELTLYKKFDVLVLIAGDGDYVPLLRKVNTLGTRVMVISWDFEYTDDLGREMITKTSQDLLDEASYPVHMHQLIEEWMDAENETALKSIFLQRDKDAPPAHTALPLSDYGGYNSSVVINGINAQNNEEKENNVGSISAGRSVLRSKTITVRNGYGFISYPPNNLFFHYSDVIGDFNEIKEGDTVEFIIAHNERGEVAKQIRLVKETVELDKAETDSHKVNGLSDWDI
jgi:uncharacterized LabA/DUF88 family protein/cold shock CspA family protein